MTDPIHIYVDRLPKLLRRCAIVSLALCLTACARSVRPPTAPGNVPPCGPTLPRQQVMLSFAGSEPFPRIRDVTWTISTHCQGQSGQTSFVNNRYVTILQTLPNEISFTRTTTFEELGLGRVIDDIAQPNLVSFTLASAAQANWCITVDVRFGGTNPPPDAHFGPVTARQMASSGIFLLNFIATVDSSGHVNIAPGFDDAMRSCVSG